MNCINSFRFWEIDSMKINLLYNQPKPVSGWNILLSSWVMLILHEVIKVTEVHKRWIAIVISNFYCVGV